MINDEIKDQYSNEVRLALLEQSIEIIKNTLLRLEERIDKIKSELEKR